MMTSSINTVRISNELDILHWKLDQYAESIGKTVLRLFPIWVILLKGKIVGWIHDHSQSILYVEISKQVSPREFYDGSRSVLAGMQRLHGDPLIAIHDREFSEKALSKIWLEKFPYALYKVVDG